jgi:hypothetical protein
VTALGHRSATTLAISPQHPALRWVIAAARSAPMSSKNRRNVPSSRVAAAHTNGPGVVIDDHRQVTVAPLVRLSSEMPSSAIRGYGSVREPLFSCPGTLGPTGRILWDNLIP